MSNQQENAGGESSPLSAAAQLAAALRPLAEAAGVVLPTEQALAVPRVRIDGCMRQLAMDMGDVLRSKGLFLWDGEVVTVDGVTGRKELMTPEMFVSWVERHLTCWGPNKAGEPKDQSMSPQKAKVILASQDFKLRLPGIRGIHQVRMPVVGADGKMRLLGHGFDGETGIFTLSGLDYDTGMTGEAALARWREVHKHFPWANGLSESVHLAAALTVYCGAMLPERHRVPLFVYNSNIPGSGKSQLVKTILLLVHGRNGTATLWDRQEDFKKELDSAAQDGSPFLFFDDLTGHLRSTLLNTWLTSAMWEGRVLGTRNRFVAALRAVTFVTGNQLSLHDDLQRRHVCVDLFSAQDLTTRVLPAGVPRMTDAWVMGPEVRKDLLACLHGMAFDPRGWGTHEGGRLIDSFEGWSGLIGPMVMGLGMEDPATRIVVPDMGGNEAESRRRVIEEAVRRYILAPVPTVEELEPDPFGGPGDYLDPVPVPEKSEAVVTLGQLAGIARELGLFVESLGTLDDVLRELDQRRGWPKAKFMDTKTLGNGNVVTGEVWREPETDEERQVVAMQYMDRKNATSFGMRIRRAQDMRFAVDGQAYRFGSRQNVRGSQFLIRRESLED